MTSRPVAPESETPETDEFSNPSTEGDNDSFVAIEHYNSLLEHARSLERRLSLAQTEIKGHMRIEDDLKTDLREVQAQLAAWQEHGKTYGFICGRFECDEAGKYHIFQNEGSEFGKSQSRIAELEKVLGGIATAKRFDRTIFAGDDAFADWARSIASHALKSRA